MKEINGIEIGEDGGITEKLIGLAATIAVWVVSLIIMHKMSSKGKD
jgi:hypothetical protein